MAPFSRRNDQLGACGRGLADKKSNEESLVQLLHEPSVTRVSLNGKRDSIQPYTDFYFGHFLQAIDRYSLRLRSCNPPDRVTIGCPASAFASWHFGATCLGSAWSLARRPPNECPRARDVGRPIVRTNCDAKGSTTMSIEQLMGRYLRLKQDLEIAYKAQPWHSGRINRLTNDIARTEQELASREFANRPAQAA